MPATTQATPKEAQRACDHLIQMVENVVVGRVDAGYGEFLGEFEPAAGRLINALRDLNQPLGDRLLYFLDFHLREHPSIRPFTELGLPLGQDDCGAPYLDVALGHTWLQHMRDFRDSLSNHNPSRSQPVHKRGGGRPKNPAVIRLKSQVAEVCWKGVQHLVKNGMALPEALSQARHWTAGDILRRINEANDHPYPLRGPEADNAKKNVTRSETWRCLRDPASLENPEEASELLAKMNAEWALENGLRPTRARQN